MFRPPSKFWTLIFFCLVLALPLPPAQRSSADVDGQALQRPAAEGKQPAAAVLQVQGKINEAELEARVLARLRHEVHGEVDDLAMRSMEQAMQRLRDRGAAAGARPIGKVLRLTFELQPEVAGVAPVSVLTRMSAYSAFADTFAAGTSFRLNVVGELSMMGVQHDRVALDFSTRLQFEDARGGESGSSGAAGSAELKIGAPEVLMSVGSRDLVLTVDEVRLP